MDKTRVALVDDHKIVRDGIKAVLLADDTAEVVAECSDAETFLMMFRGIKPDVVIADMELPGMSGYEMCAGLREGGYTGGILVLSAHTDEQTILSAVKSGVTGYLSKDAGSDELLAAIRSVVSGEEYFGEKISRIIFKSYQQKLMGADMPGGRPALNELTPRETEILKCFAEGMSYKEIGARLFISPRTVETHRNNIMDKLELSSLAGLIKYAIQNGLIKI